MSYKLEDPLFFFNNRDYRAYTYRNIFEGTLICGSLGAGKSSASGKFWALKMLKAGFGGLVLTVKPDEKNQWVEYCQLAGRSKDLLVLEPGCPYSFDFMSYLSSNNTGDALTGNLLEILKVVINAGAERSGGKNNSDPFWNQALDQLIANAIDLCLMAFGKVDVQTLYDIVQTAPHNDKPVPKPEERHKKAFYRAFTKVRTQVSKDLDTWYNGLHWAEREQIDFDGTYDAKASDAVPNYKPLKLLDQFFTDTFRNLATKTRSIVEFSFTGLLYSLLREPFYSLFCKQKQDFNPRLSLDGKVLLLNIPTKLYHDVGRDCQILYKVLWQREMEKRDITLNDRPLFLFADEAYTFLHERDSQFQYTARSSRVATIYIAQNFSQFFAALGDKSRDRVHSFLGTLNTKVFHANSDVETNNAASELIGDAVFIDPSKSVSISKDYSTSQSSGLVVERQVRSNEFVGLITGGSRNNFKVEAYIHVQGDKLFNGQNFAKVRFDQNYK
ncbi:TraM recognition domain-containing protein [Mucilaginibacter sp. PAMB04274]|uniref:TraM recognition domain-containing protein n=1 Tax=Mucilaginibacter sp. PAMB04274 TaxID=3138568 RepID=UPI0031F67A83